ncbi:MAG: hypothetical protein A3H49_01985 [Nitrospirae bacterium RIFCSPLOWO2_02_FULL_62_14]|nr:MAG: hypothetical protein A3H49_01985 [Nitrospirae bacterium RIFCSPLOWO2_02_FULL_62_14]
MRQNIANASRFALLGDGARFGVQALYVLAALALLSACAFSPKVKSEVSSKIDQYHVKTLVVLPFDALKTPQVTEHRPYDEIEPPQGIRRSDMSVSVPPAGERHAVQAAAVTPAAAERVTRSFHGKLKNWEGLKVFSPDDAAAALMTLAGAGGDMTPEQRAASVATKMTLDAAIVGRVLVYQERKGSKLGGETAAVGFEVKLVAADGTTLWVGNYYEKQKPLTEDAKGSIERGFMFQTADELVEYGTTHLAEQFPFGAKAKR